MNKLLVLLGLFLVINWHCQNDDNILFSLNYETKITLSAGLSHFQVHYFTVEDMQSNIKAALLSKGLKESDIKSIEPASAYVVSLDPGNVFDFVEEVSVKISDTNVFNKEYFYTIQVPYNAAEQLDLVGTLVNATEYLLKDRFNTQLRFKLRADVPSTFEVKLGMKFIVK